MQIDRLLYPVHSLGPGDRLAIWIRGCKKRCFNCANPELQLFNPNSEVSMTVIKEMISKIDKKIDNKIYKDMEKFTEYEITKDDWTFQNVYDMLRQD